MAPEIQSLIETLETRYGRPRRIPRFDPMEELVSCILSQHTADANSFPAFTRLRETFATWRDVVEAGAPKLVEVIRLAGLANQKSRSIVACLEEIHRRNGEYTLEPLRDMSMGEGRAWLQSLPGVGPKTASIVLCFSFGMDAIPVDTHVYRVSARLGLIPEGAGEAKAHDLLLDSVPPGLAFRFHTALIQHGRVVCKAPIPVCDECPLADRCPWLLSGAAERRKDELRLKRSKKR